MEPTHNGIAPEIEQTPQPLPGWLVAVRAAETRKAANFRVLDLREVTSFTDFFVICTGANPRQIRAIGDEVIVKLKQQGEYAISTEGYESAEWILLDFDDYIVHIFSEKAREHYGLERLWRHAKSLEIPQPDS